MKLVYTATKVPVKIGDVVTINGRNHAVYWFDPPHKSSSEGKVIVTPANEPRRTLEYYVSIIKAEWIDRLDRVFLL